MHGTGGGPPPKIAFSAFEEKVLEFLTPEAAGLENIPEGGINMEENPINILEPTAEIEENITRQDVHIIDDDENIDNTM
jgi:hypothetical protein